MPKRPAPKKSDIVPVVRAAKRMVGETDERHATPKGKRPSKKAIKALAQKLAKGR